MLLIFDIKMIMMPRIKPRISPTATLLGVLGLVMDEDSFPCRLIPGLLMSMSMLHAICPMDAIITATVPKMICQGTAFSDKKEMHIVTSKAPQVKIALKVSFAKICV